MGIGNITYGLIDLSTQDFQEYYSGLANRVLWPILHYRVDLQEYSRADASGYMRVNWSFAEKAEFVHSRRRSGLGSRLPPDAARPGTTGGGTRNPIGFFLHIPFAAPEILQALPPHRQPRQPSAYYDLVGFQTATIATISCTMCWRAGRKTFAAAAMKSTGASCGWGHSR